MNFGYLKMMLLSFASFACLQLSAQGTFQEVYDIMQVKCTGCHGGDAPQGNLDLSGTLTEVYIDLIDVAPTNPSARDKGFKQVRPGSADASYLLHKIANEDWDDRYKMDVADGNAMPPAPLAPLTKTEMELVRQWILHGAPLNKKVVERSVLEDYYENGKALPTSPQIAAPDPSEGFQLRMGPFFLNPLEEIEVFQKYDLELEEGVEVHSLDLEFNVESHHFILYKTDRQRASNVREGLRPLSEAQFAMINNELVSAWQDASSYALPENTAYRFQKDDVLDLNYHIKNYSAEGILAAEVYLNIYTQPIGTAAKEMFSTLLPIDLFGLFQGRNLGAPLIIPADGQEHTFTEHAWVPPFASGNGFPSGEWHIWQLSTHTHGRGVDYDIYLAADASGAKGEQLYEGYFNFDYVFNQGFYDWEHPAVKIFEPLLPVNMGFGGGLVHEATYVNDTDRTLRWGDTTDDEMMLVFVHFTDGPVPTVGVDKADLINTNAFKAAPNPYQGETTISYHLKDKQVVQLEVFDMLGKKIQTLCNETQTAGAYSYQFSAKQLGLASGMYLVRLNIGGKRSTQKVIELD